MPPPVGSLQRLATKKHGPRIEHEEGLAQGLVAGARYEALVELVLQGDALGCDFRLLDLLEGRMERLPVRLGRVLGKELRREPLEHLPDLVHADGLGRGDTGDDRPLVRDHLDQPLRLELPQCLAYQSAADAGHLAEIPLRHSLARPEASRGDRLPYTLRHAVPERCGRSRHEKFLIGRLDVGHVLEGAFRLLRP